MALLKKDHKSEKTQKSGRIWQKALTLGLASVVTATVLGQEKVENIGRSKKVNDKEVSPPKSHEDIKECAYYISNVALDDTSPIEQIYKVDKRKAFYSHYLNGGEGGIVFTKYHISDADLWANANRSSASKFDKIVKIFEQTALRFGYKEKIESLNEVRDCLDYYAACERKKEQHIGEILSQNADENGLTAALALQKTISEMNEANLKTATHEQYHASIGQFTKAINNGDVMLAPGGIYLSRMADELRAQIMGGNIPASEQGLEYFFEVYGAGYKDSYMPDLLGDDSYKRMFAYSLNEEKAEISLPAEINNLFLGYHMDGVDNLGNSCTINGVETSRGYVFFSGRDDVTAATMKNGHILPLNCLVDAQGKIIKNKDGKAQTARIIHQNGNFTAKVSGSVLTTNDMDINLKKALRYILGDLEDGPKKLVLKALDKYCRVDADGVTESLLRDNDAMMKLRSETDAEHIATDLKYIKEKRAALMQEAGEKNLSGLDLTRIAAPQNKKLQLTAAMFKQYASEKN